MVTRRDLEDQIAQSDLQKAFERLHKRLWRNLGSSDRRSKVNSSNIESYFSDTTDLDVERCEKCGSIDFECTNTREFCVRCGLVSKKVFYSTASTDLKEE
ncbi:hypothetical protein LCGC14_0965000 [marine sediment metagenome]|uniref:Uncharacterized protein n=1 Tax=marine sediment metagenome TaxID=412755 RepID=A0A0F9NDF0_9ZZZZ